MNAISSRPTARPLPPLSQLGLLAMGDRRPSRDAHTHYHSAKRSHPSVTELDFQRSQKQRRSQDGISTAGWSQLPSPLPTPPLLPNLLPHDIAPSLFPFYSSPTLYRSHEPAMLSPRSNDHVMLSPRSLPTVFPSLPDSTTAIPPRSSSRSLSPSASAPTANTFLTDQGLFIRRRSDQRIAKIDWTELEGWLSEIVQDGQGKGGVRLENGHPWRCRTKEDAISEQQTRQYFPRASQCISKLTIVCDTGGSAPRPPFRAITAHPKRIEVDREAARRIPSPPASIEFSPPTPSFRVLLPHPEPRPSLPRKRTREDVEEALTIAGLTKGKLYEGKMRTDRMEEDKRRWESLRGGIESNLRNSPEEEELE